MKQIFKLGNVDIQNGFCDKFKLENIELEIEVSAEEMITQTSEFMKLATFIREEAPKWKEVLSDMSAPTDIEKMKQEISEINRVLVSDRETHSSLKNQIRELRELLKNKKF